MNFRKPTHSNCTRKNLQEKKDLPEKLKNQKCAVSWERKERVPNKGQRCQKPRDLQDDADGREATELILCKAQLSGEYLSKLGRIKVN